MCLVSNVFFVVLFDRKHEHLASEYQNQKSRRHFTRSGGVLLLDRMKIKNKALLYVWKCINSTIDDSSLLAFTPNTEPLAATKPFLSFATYRRSTCMLCSHSIPLCKVRLCCSMRRSLARRKSPVWLVELHLNKRVFYFHGGWNVSVGKC